MSETPDYIEELNNTMHKFDDLVAEAQLRESAYDGVTCPMCLKELSPELKDDPDAIYHEVVSWVTGAKLQSPVLRSRTGRIAHRTCVEKCINGEAPDQQPIPGLEL